MRQERADHSLDASDMVNQLWLRLKKSSARIVDRGRLLFEASNAMNWIILDRARRRGTQKRLPPGNRVELETVPDARSVRDNRKEALDAAIEKLETVKKRPATIIKLHFTGCTVDEIAQQLRLSRSSVEKDLAFARNWLQKELLSKEDLL